MLCEIEKSSDVCRTASLSEMGHEQRAATSSTVTDQRRKNFFVRKYKVQINVHRHGQLCIPCIDTVLVSTINTYVYTNMHTHWYNSRVPGKPRLARCPLNFPSPFSPRLCIIPRHIKSLYNLLDTISPRLEWTSLWFSSFHCHNPFSITCVNHPNLAFFITKLTALQSRQFSQFCDLLSN